jgi:hypothetical protein
MLSCCTIEPPSGSSCCARKMSDQFINAGFSVEKQFPFIPASSVHLDSTDAAKIPTMRSQK